MEVRLRAYVPSALAPTRRTSKARLLASVCAPALLGALSLATSNPAVAACQGPGTQTASGGAPQTKCVTAVQIPGNPLRSFDISFVSKQRDEYYLGDRSNKGVDVVNTNSLKWLRTITGGTSTCTEPGTTTPCQFVGVVLSGGKVDNNHSGPDGVVSHGRWLYAGDGNSTLKAIDLNIPGSNAIVQSVSTGGTTRVDEMDVTSDGKLLLAANNAETPPFATLFSANGDDSNSHVTKIIKITIDPTILPADGSIEQPAWDPQTKRFYTSIPIIENNPPGCVASGPATAITCDGGLLVTDPTNLAAPQCNPSVPGVCQQGAFDPVTNTGVVKLQACGPNGATVGPFDNLLLGCTPGNNAHDTITQVINAKTKNFVNIGNITGSDEVSFNKADNRYYLGASKSLTPTPNTSPPCTTPNGAAQSFCAVLGVVNATTNFLIEAIPQSTNSHSVAADPEHSRIFVPQVAPFSVVGSGGDTTTTGQQICGSQNGCIAVYEHKADPDEDGDHQGDDRRSQLQ